MSFGNKVKLNTGAEIPTLGYGTWQSSPGEVSVGIYEALKIGYRHLDLAKIYQNQAEVAQGLKKAFAEMPGLKREDIFITSKLWNHCHRPEDVELALDDTLKELGLNYLDLYLIHWPVAFPRRGGIGEKFSPISETDPTVLELDESVSIVDTWKAMVKLPKSKVRAVGVSNFTVENIKAVIDGSGVVPAANQIERHPRLQQMDTVIAFAKEKGIHITAYSAFGNNGVGEPLLITHDVVKRIADKHSATGAQVILAWSQIGGHSVIPKSVHVKRIQENFQEIKLDADDVAAVDAIGKARRRFNIPFNYKPSWDISVFAEEPEKNARHQVVR